MRQHLIRFTCVYCISGFECFLIYTSKPAAILISLTSAPADGCKRPVNLKR
jgi:hypothetical protein